MQRKKWIMILFVIVAALAVLGIAAVLIINAYVTGSVKDRILTPQESADLTDVDCVLVLGCQVQDNGEPSHMLRDRLLQSVELYELNAGRKLLMSGDHGQTGYDEVNTMKQFAIDAGVPSADIFMDHAGFSTYESIYRAKEIFGAKKILIVTQEYHLYRALYIARCFGIDAYGVSSDLDNYYGQFHRDVREILARVKDFGLCILKVKPTYLGEPIDIHGNGDLTNDQ